MRSSRLTYIDAWRAIAIALVLLCHIVGYSHPWYRETSAAIVWRVQGIGILGVQLFFCISGFVICRAMISEVEKTGSISLLAFYIRRAYRILPPFLAMILVTGILGWLDVIPATISQLTQATTFLCNIPEFGACGWHLIHTWSLAYEEQFYLIFPLIFIALALPHNRIKFLAAAMALIFGLLIFAAVPMPETAAYFSHFLCMITGCLFSLYWKQLEPIMEKLPFTIWIMSIGVILAFKGIGLPPVVANFVAPVVLPILIGITIFGTPLRFAKVSKAFNNSTLIYIGRISYGIYLWQQLATADYGFQSPLQSLPLVVGACVLAHFSFKYVEQNLMVKGRLASERAIARGTKLTGNQELNTKQKLSNLPERLQ
jgi:peptidoglycan/LPS O-acetylase OafA/YrhL